MNDWQTARQIKHILENARWAADGTGRTEYVLQTVTATPATTAAMLSKFGTHFALINVEDATASRSHPGKEDQVFALAFAAKVPGGEAFEGALIGGGVTDSANYQTAGRGVLEIANAALADLRKAFRSFGFNIQIRNRGGAVAGEVEGVGHMVQRIYRVEAVCTDQKFFHAPQDIQKVGNDVSWRLPPDRWDRSKIRLFGKAGSTPPTYEEAGTEIVLGASLSTSVTHIAATPYSYSVFCQYDEGLPAAMTKPASDAGTDKPGTTLVLP